jgi:hypothetical protein
MFHRMLHMTFLALGAFLVSVGLLLVTWVSERGAGSSAVVAASTTGDLVALSSGAPAAPPAPDDGRAVFARVKAATGGSRWDEVAGDHRVGALATAGVVGKTESWSDARACRFVDRYELGPMKGAEGFDGRRAWSQDSSGQARVEEGGDTRTGSANEAFRRCLGLWYPARWKATFARAGERTEGSRRFEVVTVTPEGGRPFDVWVDLTTYRIDREVEKTALDTRTIFYSDYRTVEGLAVPFSVRQSNGNAKYDQVTTLRSISFAEPVDAARFELPAPPPPDYALRGNATSTSVPFELVNNHIYVDVKLNGRGPYRLLCDTGGMNVVTKELARELGLEAQGALEGRGAGEGSQDLALTKVRSLELGDLRLDDQVFIVFDLASFSDVEGVPEQGLVGYEIFKRFVVSIDYAHRVLRLTVPSAFAYRGTGAVVPFKFNEHIPQVQGTLDGIPGAFDLDTGARDTLTVLAPFAEKHELARRYGTSIEAVTGWGVGGPSRGKVARAGVLTLGPVRVEGPVVDLSLQKKGSFVDPYVAGNVGGGLLKRFTVTFDYTRQQVIFEPNELATKRDVYDRAGLWLNRDPRGFVVLDVVARGPAAEAGLAVGDRVTAVDGKPARDVGLPALRERLRGEPGTRVKLDLEGPGGEARAVVVTLRDLV